MVLTSQFGQNEASRLNVITLKIENCNFFAQKLYISPSGFLKAFQVKSKYCQAKVLSPSPKSNPSPSLESERTLGLRTLAYTKITQATTTHHHPPETLQSLLEVLEEIAPPFCSPLNIPDSNPSLNPTHVRGPIYPLLEF